MDAATKVLPSSVLSAISLFSRFDTGSQSAGLGVEQSFGSVFKFATGVEGF